jgi:hypothetical protein
MGIAMPDINENPNKFIEKFLLALGEAAKLPKNRNDLSFMLTQIPGMSALNLGLRQPNLANELNRLQNITEQQADAADKILKDINELDVAMRRWINEALPPASRVVHGLRVGASEIRHGQTLQGVHDIAGAIMLNPNQRKADTTQGWGWLMSQGLFGMWLNKTGPFAPQTYFPDPGLITGGNPRFVNPNMQSGREIPHVTIHITAPPTGNPQAWGRAAADAFYDAVGIQANGGSR